MVNFVSNFVMILVVSEPEHSHFCSACIIHCMYIVSLSWVADRLGEILDQVIKAADRRLVFGQGGDTLACRTDLRRVRIAC